MNNTKTDSSGMPRIKLSLAALVLLGGAYYELHRHYEIVPRVHVERIGKDTVTGTCPRGWVTRLPSQGMEGEFSVGNILSKTVCGPMSEPEMKSDNQHPGNTQLIMRGMPERVR